MTPAALEAECALLGSVFFRAEALEVAAEIVQPEDFVGPVNRAMYEAMLSLSAERKPIDHVAVANLVKPLALMEPHELFAYIAEVLDSVPTSLHADQYASIVRDKAIQRSIIQVCAEVGSDAEQREPAELLAVMEYEAARLSSRTFGPADATKADTLASVLWKIEHRQEESVPSGFPALDQSFGGFNIGHLTILAARTSIGKTALATNFALNAAKRGHQVGFFTLEMTAEEMWIRALACESQVNLFEAKRRGYRNSNDAQLVNEAHGLMRSLPLEIIYRPAMRPRDLRLECRRLKRQMTALKLVVVDYFNLMRGDRSEKERWREMQEAIVALKQIAGELGIPILLLSQLNREVDEKHAPSLSHLRDTGATEEHASNVLFLWQPQIIAGTDYQDVELLLAKQRNGPANLKIPLKFNKASGTFF